MYIVLWHRTGFSGESAWEKLVELGGAGGDGQGGGGCAAWKVCVLSG